MDGTRTERRRQTRRPALPLFADAERSDAPQGRSEPLFAFLERSSTAYVEQIRTLMAEWFGNVPAEHHDDLAGRLRSKDDAQSQAAFWELYLHQAYNASGYHVTIHPQLPSSGRHTDFLITGYGSRFYLEAVSAHIAATQTRSHKLLQDFLHALDQIRADRFQLDVATYAVGATMPNLRGLRHQLRSWLATLDHNSSEHQGAAGSRGAAARHAWRTDDGWRVDFTAVPLPSDQAGQRSLLRAHSTGGWSDDAAAVTVALETKADRYGALDAPLVIAVLCNTEFGTDNMDVETALYGALIGCRPNEQPPPTHAVHKPGLWTGTPNWRRGHCPQVITAHDLYPWTVPVVRPRLWTTLEPNTTVPAQPDWLTPVDVTGPYPQVGTSSSIRELFGLPDPWPTVPLQQSPRPATAEL